MLAPLRLDHDGISGFASNQLRTAPVLEVSSFQNLNNEPGLTEKNRGKDDIASIFTYWGIEQRFRNEGQNRSSRRGF